MQVILVGLMVAMALSPWSRPTYAETPPGNLIQNGLFERFVTYGNITIGEHWAPFIISGEVFFNRNGFEPGQQLQSFGKAFVAGIYQQVGGAVPGATYYAYVGTASKYGPNDSGCLNGHVARTIGIDPYGGTDPTSPSIVWGSETWKDGCGWEWKDDPKANAPKVRAVAQSDKLTLFIKVTYINNDLEAKAWLDDAAMIRDNSVPIVPVGPPTETPVPTPAPTETPAPTPTPEDTATPTVTPTLEDTATPAATITPTPPPAVTPTATSTLTPSPLPTSTPTSTATVTTTPTQTSTPSPTTTPTSMPTLLSGLNAVGGDSSLGWLVGFGSLGVVLVGGWYVWSRRRP